MALDDIDQLSDENGGASSQDKKEDRVTPDAKTAKLKATRKAPAKNTKAAAAESDPTSGGGRKPALKRPASASSAGTKSEPVMKRPAGRVKDPDFVSVCKSLYKRDGVWSIKLGTKEVIRATGPHWMNVKMVMFCQPIRRCNVHSVHCRPDHLLATQVKPVPDVPSDELERIAVPWIFSSCTTHY